MGFLMLVFVIAFLIYAFTGGGMGTDRYFGPPKKLPLERYEEVEVNVLYRYGNQGFYLGKVIGTTACRELAYDYAAKQNYPEGVTWSYLCCTEEGRSVCDRKLK